MINFKNFLKNYKKNLLRLNSRGLNYSQQVNYLKNLFQIRNQILIKLEQLQFQVNQYNQKFKSPSSPFSVASHILLAKQIIQILKSTMMIVGKDFQSLLLSLPNLPHLSVPVGLTTKENKIIFVSKTKKNKSIFSHWEIGQKLTWLDNVRAVKMAQSRFVIYQNEGAKLLRVLQNFMLDHHQKLGYCELVVPHLVKEKTLWGTGQFPKMKNDCYQIKDHDLFLLPTSEVALVNYFANFLFQSNELPQKLCSYSLCFRQEAGAAGKINHGLVRLHQFHKVELVKFTDQESSYQELESMVIDAQNILKLLSIPYRVVELCTGDLGFAASKTYDLEVWMPFEQKYLEVASLSNTEDFQSQYLKIKYQDLKSQKHFTHVLNGSGLAIDRLIACLLEHYYNTDNNTFVWPPILQKYL